MVARSLIIVAVLVATAEAQVPAPSAPPPPAPAPAPRTTSDALRDGNAAANAGDWQHVAQLVDPLLQGQLAPSDLAEAHRLAGLAAFFQQRNDDAEAHFLAYLRIDLDGNLDPTLYPPDVIKFFDNVKYNHSAELKARRPKQKRYLLLSLVPFYAQWQNQEHTKAIVVGSLLGALAIGNIASYYVLQSWCVHAIGSAGESYTCDDAKNHAHTASQLRVVNLATGIGLIATYLYGVYDGVQGYRRWSREQALQLFVTSTGERSVVGISGSF